MVWKLQMKRPSTLSRNKPHSKTLISPDQRATIVKNQVTIRLSAVNSNERKTKHEIIQVVLITTLEVPKRTLTPTTKLQTIPQETI